MSGSRLAWLMRWALALLCIISARNTVFAQPSNDNCSAPGIVPISGNGFGIGIFNSSTEDITTATIQTGETFAPAILVAGQTSRSIWYKFTLPTTRQIKVTLLQTGTGITAGDVGFTVYRTNNCIPGNADISTKLTPITGFGNTSHPCVDSGTYYVQVSSKAGASGTVFIAVETSFPPSSYDRPSQAYNFGTLAPGITSKSYQVQCQSVEDANEVCSTLPNYAEYNKSTWHIFKTPAYFDYLALMVAKQSSGNEVVGYRIYEGDVTVNPYTTLPVVATCSSFQLDDIYFARRYFNCSQLQANKTYSVQLFFRNSFTDLVKVSIALAGTGATQAPQPVLANIPPSNALGLLPAPIIPATVSATDQFGCNSRHATTACGNTITNPGYIASNGTTYNLSSFFTFTIGVTSNISIDVGMMGYQTANVIRLYNQAVTSSCSNLSTSNIIGEYLNSSGDIACLPPGNYTVQVMGTHSTSYSDNWAYSTFSEGYMIIPTRLYSDMGNKFLFSITVQKSKAINKFSLSSTGAFDSIHVVSGAMQPMVNNVLYQSKPDTFGCANTVRPWDTTCASGNTRVMYREMMIADSGVLSLIPNTTTYFYQLYKGDASALATAQNIFAYPGKIQNMVPWSSCYQIADCGGAKVCVVPGTYTYATFASGVDIAQSIQPSFRFNTVTTQYGNPASPEDLGDIIAQLPPTGGSISSTLDYYSCKDNAVTINGFTPCNISNIPATKAIYRQFYLSSQAMVAITGFHTSPGCGFVGSGLLTLFSGKVSNGLSTLTVMPQPWQCFSVVDAVTCKFLPAGWYTLVSYGSGPTYANPVQNTMQNGQYGSYVARTSKVMITISPGCTAPKYNRPYKAAYDTITGQPFLIEWGPNGGHTAAYPKTEKVYKLYKENFNCTNDTPFILHPINSCDPSLTKVAYWVFKTTQESYVQIDTKQYFGAVYAGNARTDSASFATSQPIQPCLNGQQMQICRLQPGVYTLVVFADSTKNCNNVQPEIYIDRTGYSRFDHANNAYDFGLVPPDSLWHKGRVGDVNPYDTARAPSNDFFYCTTGAQINDPADANCLTEYRPQIYNPNVNNFLYPPQAQNPGSIPRRNLWYTFVTDQGGYVRIRVNNKTIGKGFQYRYAVYKSDVNGSIPFSQVVSSGDVDSTAAQGLSLVAIQEPFYPYFCWSVPAEISFYRKPCNTVADRYYIVVQNTSSSPNDAEGMRPNSQVEVSVLVDSVLAVPTLFDHYSTAGIIGTNLGSGTYSGPKDNYSCASTVTPDPVSPPYPDYASCATKTIWYRFSTTVSGKIRYRVKINDSYANGSSYDQVTLLRQLVPGDSTISGLAYTPYNNQVVNAQGVWYQTCLSPGTYYLFLTGCNRTNESVIPEIQIAEEQGDFCSAPVIATLGGPGTTTATVSVDCHTIGTDYGEFNQNLTCPNGGATINYKTSWFKINITGNDTLDVSTFLSENTNALSTDIKYRIMEGNCNAMQERSCVQDALTQDTYECLPAGNYYVQLFVPIAKNGSPVLGTVDLHLTGTKHSDTCAPMKNCLSTAVFTPQYDCNISDTVRFTNLSTYGSDIQYLWDFGYNNQTSNAVSPVMVYPALSTNQTYTIKLKVTNNGCVAGSKNSDSATFQLLVKARPNVNLGKDTVMCVKGSTIVLNASTWPGTTYLWSTGQTSPSITVSGGSVNNIWINAAYNGCVKKDTINIYINPIDRIRENKYLCGNDSVYLESFRGNGEKYLWTGPLSYWYPKDTGRIYAISPALYVNHLDWYGCKLNDSFNVMKTPEPFLKPDTTICYPFQSFLLSAQPPGAVSYTWQNGSTGQTFSVAGPGVYTVQVNNGNCTKKDSIKVMTTAAAIIKTVNAVICPGQPFTLPWGPIVFNPGVFSDTVHYAGGCDSLIRTVNLSNAAVVIKKDTSFCDGETYRLPWGITVNTAGLYADTVRTTTGCDSLIRSVRLTINPNPVVSASKSNDVNCVIGTATLNATGNFRYLWSPAASLSNAGIRNPVASPAATTTYVVQAISNNGCISKDSIQVLVVASPGPGFELPNAFTPDGDGLNDCFGVRSWGAVSDLKLTVYNRWGELVFKTTNPSVCWDGTINGKKQGTAVFVYYVTANTICGKVNKSGTVTLIR